MRAIGGERRKKDMGRAPQRRLRWRPTPVETPASAFRGNATSTGPGHPDLRHWRSVIIAIELATRRHLPSSESWQIASDLESADLAAR